MDVGEEFLDAMLHLRLDASTADDATVGWDGGVYRAWTDGTDVAVVMDTAWDSTADASAFVAAMDDWNARGDGATAVTADANHVRLVFATSAAVLDRATSALAKG